jgi:hypothetical protein
MYFRISLLNYAVFNLKVKARKQSREKEGLAYYIMLNRM